MYLNQQFQSPNVYITDAKKNLIKVELVDIRPFVTRDVVIAIRFSDPNFLKESNNLAIRRRFHAVTLTFDIDLEHL